MYQKSFSYRKSKILCIKKDFHAENHRFCASKKFFIQKIKDSVHQKSFSSRKSKILCIKKVFSNKKENALRAECILFSKKWIDCLRPEGHVLQNLAQGGMRVDDVA